MKKLLLPFLSILLFTSCHKTNTNPPNPPINLDSTLNKNVVSIDSTKLILTSDTTQLNHGHLEYTVIGAVPKINVNDVIVGPTLGGYIMRVSSINQQGNKVTIESTQGTMEDVFNNAKFDFSTNMDNLKPARVMSGYHFDVSGQTIYQDGALNITLDKGIIDIDGNWNFGFNFKNSKLDSFELSNKNATFNGQFVLNVTASQAITLAEHSSTIGRIAKYNIFIIAGVPVVVYTEVELRCVFSATIAASVKRNLQINTTNTANIGIKYINSQWQNTFANTSNSSITIGERSGNINIEINMAIVPYVSFRLYRILGPYASIGLKELIKGNVASPSLDWDFYAGAWIQTIVGARAGIFSKSWVDYSKEWNTDTIKYQTPYKIEKTSGDIQTGTANEFLNQPLKVRVLDNNGGSEANVPVYFNVTAGGGSVETPSILSDKDGYAQTRWKIGTQNVIQTVEANVKNADGSLISGAPVVFAATASPSVIAPSVTICTQVWMVKNLDVSTYRNGDPIPEVTDPTAWAALTTGAWCYYNNDPAMGVIYGKLYNWYAVNDPRGLAPTGWHVPSDAEWTTLSTCLGGEAGGAMKETGTTHWLSPNTGATNSSGFTGLPGGSGNNGAPLTTGVFKGVGYNGYWWSSTESSTTNAQFRYLGYNYGYIGSYPGIEQGGYSVRCLRD